MTVECDYCGRWMETTRFIVYQGIGTNACHECRQSGNERHLVEGERRVMDKALRRSTKPITTAPVDTTGASLIVGPTVTKKTVTMLRGVPQEAHRNDGGDMTEMMNDEAVRKLVRSLRESAHTFDQNETHTLPAMQGFIRRHVRELLAAADQLEHSIGLCMGLGPKIATRGRVAPDLSRAPAARAGRRGLIPKEESTDVHIDTHD